MPKFRMTSQRQLILLELRKSKSHPTADSIFSKIREKLPNISLGTVYRNLDILSDMGHVTKMEGYGSQRRYDGNLVDHSHVRCMKCGKVDDINDETVTKIDSDSVGIPGYIVLRHTVVFDGVCMACAG